MYLHCVFVLLLCVIQARLSQMTTDSNKLLNWCIAGKYHKSEPGPEDQLHERCTPWKKRACCTSNTTEFVHAGNMYNLNFDHCSEKGKMSEKCKNHFIQDLCFYECEPNLGPWVVKVNHKYRKERAFKVPLCAQDCDRWFEDCSEDYTCVENWVRELVTMDNVKQCPTDKECKTFKEIYTNSSNFCEKVWNNAWKYTPNEEPCMKIWFDETKGNPNQKVAEQVIEERMAILGAASSSLTQTIVAMVLTIFVTVFVCH